MRFQEEDENVKSLRTTDDGRRTTHDARRTTDDGRTDDGRKRTAIAHSSLRLRWAKNATKFSNIEKQLVTSNYSCSQKVNRTETDHLKSKPVFNLKPFLGFSSRWSRNIVEDFKNMGKTDHDQHQIDKNHYCSVTFSKITNENRLISTYKALVRLKKMNSLVFNSSKLIHIRWKICLTIGYRLTENRPDLEGGYPFFEITEILQLYFKCGVAGIEYIF